MLHGIDLSIAPGERVGLIGHSGAGKSTLVNLLLRFHDVEGGRILIDGQDIAGVARQSLRSQIGVVLQDSLLFDGTVQENIELALPDATPEQIVAAAKVAGARKGLAVPVPDSAVAHRALWNFPAGRLQVRQPVAVIAPAPSSQVETGERQASVFRQELEPVTQLQQKSAGPSPAS